MESYRKALRIRQSLVAAFSRIDSFDPMSAEARAELATSHERMADMLRADAARWAPVIKAAGVKIE